MTDNETTVEFARPEVADLMRRLVEATRARPEDGVVDFIPPAGSEQAAANYHHFVFGQRGSGKSSLLQHIRSEARATGKAAVWLDQELLKELTYPDVLLTCVLHTLRDLDASLGGRPSQPQGFWSRLLRRPPQYEVDDFRDRLSVMIENLEP